MATTIRIQSQFDPQGLDQLAKKFDTSIQYAANKGIEHFNQFASRITSSLGVVEQALDRIAAKMANIGRGAGAGGGGGAGGASQGPNPAIAQALQQFGPTGAYRMTMGPNGGTANFQYVGPGGATAWVNQGLTNARFNYPQSPGFGSPFAPNSSFIPAPMAGGYIDPSWMNAQNINEQQRRAQVLANQQALFNRLSAYGPAPMAGPPAPVLSMLENPDRIRERQAASVAAQSVMLRGAGTAAFQDLVSRYGLTLTGSTQRTNQAGQLVEQQMYSGGGRSLMDRLLGRGGSQYSATFDPGTGQYSFRHMTREAEGFGTALSKAKDGIVAFAASIFSLRAVGGMFKSILIDPISDFTKRIISATEEYRRFELAISGVSGGMGRSRDINRALLSQARDLPLSVKELHDAGIGLTFTQYGASRVATGSADQAARSMTDYGILLSQLQFLAPEQGISGAAIAVREALAGNFQSARRRLNTSPELIASALEKPSGGRYTLAEITGNQELTMRAFQSFADTWIGQEPIQGRLGILGEVQKKLNDAITQAAAKIGDAGLYDRVVDRFRGMMDRIFKFIDDPRFSKIADRLSDAMLRVFDAVGDSILSLLQRMTGTGNTNDMLARMGDVISSTAEKVAGFLELIPSLAGALGEAIGEVGKAITSVVKDLYTLVRSPEQYAFDKTAQGMMNYGAWAISAMSFGAVPKMTFDGNPLSGNAAVTMGQSIPGMGGGGFFASERMADIAGEFTRQSQLRDFLAKSSQSGNIRPLASSILSGINEGSTLFTEMGGTGGMFEFYPSPFTRSRMQAKSLPTQILNKMAKIGPAGDRSQIGYADLVSANAADLKAFHAFLLSAQNTNAIPGFSGILPSGAAGTIGEKIENLKRTQSALAQLPNAAGQQLANVSGALMYQADSLPVGVRGTIQQQIIRDAMGLVGQVSDAMKLPPEKQAELESAFRMAMEENALFFTLRQQSTARDQIASRAKIGYYAGGTYTRALTPRAALQAEANLLPGQIGELQQRYRAAQSDGDIEKMGIAAESIAQLESRLHDLRYRLNDTQQAIDQFSTSARDSLQGGIGEALYNVYTQTGDVSDAFRSMTKSIIRSFADMNAQMLTQGLFGDLFKPGAGAGGIGTGGAGGILGSLIGMFRGGSGNGVASNGLPIGVAAPQFVSGGSSAAVSSLPIGVAAPMAMGGIFPGSFLPMQAFSDGGIVSRPMIGLVGEGGQKEAVVPLPDGRSIPVSMNGGGRTYIIARDEADAVSKGFNPSMDDMVVLENAMAKSVARNGALGQAIRNKFGR